MLIHTIQHPHFGIAAIMEEAIGGGTLIYEQSAQYTEIYKRFSRSCKSRLASRGR
jgi:hypothetical protein